MTEIREQALVVAEAREELNGAVAVLAASQVAWESETKAFHEAVADAKKITLEAETKLRDIALAAYLESQDKRPGPGVEIKVGTKLTYEPDEAFAWAKEHGLALMLNVRSFEALAKANPIPCVTSKPEPKTTLATDMRKALEIKEGN